MPDVYLTDDSGRTITTDAGQSIIAYSYSAATNSPASQTPDDFAAEIMALMPRGLAWPRERDSLHYQVAESLALTCWRVQQRANYLLVDAFPNTTLELLPEWEAVLGLPDPCLGLNPTIAQRQQSVRAAFVRQGGQAASYFIAAAAALGVTVTITEFAPSRFGTSAFGEPFADARWGYAWQVNAPFTRVSVARYGLTYFGEPYASWGTTELECTLNAIKPAHTVLTFTYSGSGRVAALDDFNLDVDILA